MDVQPALGGAARDPIDPGQLVLKDLSQARGEIVLETVAVFEDGVDPAGSGVLRRAVLELQQVLDDHGGVAQHCAFLGITQALDLLDEVVQIECLEAPRAQEIGLNLGPDVEVLLVEIGRRARVRRHSGSF